MKRLVAILILVSAPFAASHAASREEVVEVQFSEIRSDLLQLEGLLADTGSFLSDMIGSGEGAEPMEFGSWEIHGGVEPAANGGFVGRGLQCRFGEKAFLCDGRIVIESAPSGRIYTGMLLASDSMPINSLIPVWARSLRRNLGPLADGNARIGLVRSIGPEGDSMVHRYEAVWQSTGGTISNESGSLLGDYFSTLMKSMPYPFYSDRERPAWKVIQSTVSIRYFPRYYTPELAKRKLGDDRLLQEMIVSLEISVEVPRQFLFLKSPHRYRLKLSNVPLRLYESRN